MIKIPDPDLKVQGIKSVFFTLQDPDFGLKMDKNYDFSIKFGSMLRILMFMMTFFFSFVDPDAPRN
jgi:hypothetical protein